MDHLIEKCLHRRLLLKALTSLLSIASFDLSADVLNYTFTGVYDRTTGTPQTVFSSGDTFVLNLSYDTDTPVTSSQSSSAKYEEAGSLSVLYSNGMGGELLNERITVRDNGVIGNSATWDAFSISGRPSSGAPIGNASLVAINFTLSETATGTVFSSTDLQPLPPLDVFENLKRIELVYQDRTVSPTATSFVRGNIKATIPPPLLLSSRSKAIVGEELFLLTTADLVGNWSVSLGEKDEAGNDRVISGFGSDRWGANFLSQNRGLQIEYFTPGIKSPTITVDGVTSTVAEPIIISCYRDRGLNILNNESEKDCDGDALLNQWEIAGFGVVDMPAPSSDGSVTRSVEILNLKDRYGVSPQVRDLIVEVDIVDSPAGITLNNVQELLAPVVAAYRNNPTGNEINLIIDPSENVTESAIDDLVVELLSEQLGISGSLLAERCETIQSCREWAFVVIGAGRLGAELVKCDGFWSDSGIRNEYPNEVSAELCQKREEAYVASVRHAFVGESPSLATNRNGETLGGIAEPIVGGFISNKAVLDGNGVSTTRLQRAFMHELGHLLGLRHGGGDNTHCKPNYFSIMNYRYAYASSGRSPLDYSRSNLLTMFPNSMVENAPFQVLQGELDTRFGVRIPSFVNPFNDSVSSYKTVDVDSPAIDWNGNFIVSDNSRYYSSGSQSSCNYSAYNGAIPLEGRGEAMTGFHDWNNLLFDRVDAARRVTGNSIDSNSTEGVPEVELSRILDEYATSDFDEDGVLSSIDNCPYESNSDQIDGDGDGVGAACDICPFVFDPDQLDSDGNSVGDACDVASSVPPLMIPNNQWVQFGVPLDAGPLGVDDLFENALDFDQFGTQWIVYKYFGPIEGYRAISAKDPIEPGVGYWLIQVTGATVFVQLPYSLKQSQAIASDACPDNHSKCWAVGFDESETAISWQIVSNPTESPMDVSKLFFTLATDSERTSVLVGNTVDQFRHTAGIFIYDGSMSEYRFLVPGEQLQPWEAGWAGVLPADFTGNEVSAGFVN